jgi:hypothetical protein
MERIMKPNARNEAKKLRATVDRTLSDGDKWRALVEASGIQGDPKARNAYDLIQFIGQKAVRDAGQKLVEQFPTNMER